MYIFFLFHSFSFPQRGGAAGTSGAAVSPKSRKRSQRSLDIPRMSFFSSLSLASVKPSDRISLIAVLKHSLCTPSVLGAVAALISTKQKHFENLRKTGKITSLTSFTEFVFDNAQNNIMPIMTQNYSSDSVISLWICSHYGHVLVFKLYQSFFGVSPNADLIN